MFQIVRFTEYQLLYQYMNVCHLAYWLFGSFLAGPRVTSHNIGIKSMRKIEQTVSPFHANLAKMPYDA